MPAELFSVEQVERARRYHRPLYLALLLDVTLGLAVLSVAAFTGAGDRLYGAVDSLPWWGRALAFPALVVGVSTLVRLPLAFWRGLVRERRFGFSTQTARGWLFDRLKGFGVGVVLTSVAILALVGLARAFPSWWPVVAAPAAAVAVLLFGFVAPVVLANVGYPLVAPALDLVLNTLRVPRARAQARPAAIRSGAVGCVKRSA